MAITLQAQQADGTWSIRNAFVTENAQVVSGAMKAADLEAKARKVMSQWQQTAPDGKTLRIHNSETERKIVAPSRSSARMRQCFYCGDDMGVLSNADYDPLDTCGKRECEREARAEAREQIQEDRDWACN